MRIGAYIGKFYPPHIGHLSVIDGLYKEFDEFWIIISYNQIRNNQIECEVGFSNLPPKLIKSWFQKHYDNIPNIRVAIFDETNLKPYPDDVDDWAEKFKTEFPSINAKIADESYREFNQKYFPDYEFVSIDRDIINIHSTQIRNDLKLNMDMIIPEAKSYFEGIIYDK